MKQTVQRKQPARDGGTGRAQAPRRQRGGTVIGFIVGVVVGLVAALAVAVYVTKVPIPFMSGKTQGRSADHDAAESKKNQNWDPNAPLYGKNPARPAAPAAPAPAPSIDPGALPETARSTPAPSTRPSPAPSADPLGDLARARSASPAPAAPTAPSTNAAPADPFEYFVQAGAFRTPEDAESQRVRLAMMGLEARVTEREQAGRTVYRVRMGPYRNRDDAERTKERLSDSGADTALVRVQR